MPDGGAHLRARERRWVGVGLRWLPAAILVVVLVATGAVAAGITGPASRAALVTADRPVTPITSVRRDLTPLAEQAAARNLRVAIDAFLPSLPPDTCLNVRTEGVVVEHRPDDPQVPASTQKLLTAVAALLVLGPDARLRTTVVAPAAVDAAGTLAGDLHLVGGGDPLLATADYVARYPNQPQSFTDLGALADALVATGLRRVDGSVVGDDTRYDAVRYNPAWPPRFVTQGQTGPLSALAVNDGFVTWPGRGSGPGQPAADPPAEAAAVLRELLVVRGVEVVGGATSGPAPADAPELAAIDSLPVREIVGQSLRESDNATAELLLKELGLQVVGEGTFEAGTAAVGAVLADAGIDLDGAVVRDGSGLAEDDIVTCDLLVDLLRHPPTAVDVRDGLAVAGETGTLARRWLGTDLVGRVRAKTGTLNQVTSLAGDVTGSDGRLVRFALVVNIDAPAVIQRETVAAQQTLMEILAAHPRRPDLEPFRP